MLQREVETLPTHVYPPDPWRLVEQKFNPKRLPQMETLFALSNGFLGIRASFEEGGPVYEKGTLINGFHETWPITYGESAYGFARTGQTIVNVPDGTLIRLYVDDEPFDLSKSHAVHFERNLDMRNGVLEREVIWEKGSGKQIRIRSRRLVSFEHRHVAAIDYEVTLLNAEAPIVISSELVYQQETSESDGDQRGSRSFQDRVLLHCGEFNEDARAILHSRTRTSGMTLACGMDHQVAYEDGFEVSNYSEGERGRVIVSAQGSIGKTLRLTKYLTYHVSSDADSIELAERAERALDRALVIGFDSFVESQESILGKFWENADVELRGDVGLQQVMRFNLFHIYQASARTDGVGMPAKGLTGHGYEGHYFWDTEVYVLPFLTYTQPKIARNLLRFRYRMLDAARKRAGEVNQRGALFPWRTINGEEASSYYAAGTAQYHINADIVFAIRHYTEVTGDTDFLHQEGAEILIETARMWASLGFYADRKGGEFCINGVTGPDEYNTVVDNNAFTNMMARENLWYAAATLWWLRDHKPVRYAALKHDTHLRDSEMEEWQAAADKMYIPYDEEKGIHLQDDAFLSQKPWDFEGTPANKYPLLLHFHPLVIYRHRVIKQADIVLAMLLLRQQFAPEQVRRNFEYYDPLTTGDSSLSVSIQSVFAMELGDTAKWRKYLTYALWMDLANVHANVEHGCHIASMGGTWLAMVHGIAGMRHHDGRIIFHPKLSEPIDSLRFPVSIRGRRLLVDLDGAKREVTYLLKSGDPVTIYHFDEAIDLVPEAPVSRPLEVV